MKHLIIALQSEYIKARHQKTWLLILLTAVLLPLLYGIITMIEGPRNYNTAGIISNYYDDVYSIASGFAIIFLPFAIAAITAQVTSVEHKNNTWQLIETQPVTKWAIYLAKYIKAQIGILLTIILFFIAAYFVLFAIYHGLKLDPTHFYLKLEIGKVINAILNMWLASFSFTASLFSLLIIFKKTNIITSLALISILGYTIAKGLNVNVSTLVPIVQLDKATAGFSEIGEYITFYSRLSFVQSLFILAFGYVLYYFRNYRTFGLKNKKAIGRLAIILLVGGTIVTWLHIPKYQVSYGKTILAGTFESDKKIDTLLLLNNDRVPTLAIPIDAQGNFHVEIKDSSIVQGLYNFMVPSLSMVFLSEKGESLDFYWGNGDSVYAALTLKNNVPIAKYSGDRQAERKYATDIDNEKLSYLNMAIENKYTNYASVDEFLKKLEKDYNTDLKNSYNATTIDGLKVAKDVQKSNLSLLNLKAVEVWNKFKIMNPKLIATDAPTPAFIQKVKAAIPLNDRTLLSYQSFRDYYYTTLNNGNAQIKDLDRLNLIAKIQDPQAREDMYFDAFSRILNNNVLEDSIIFDVIETNQHKITKQNLNVALSKLYIQRKANSNKDVLPPYLFKDTEEKEQGLQQFLGKYVIIDVWATWCPPCKYNAPYFYEMADKYEGKNIVFVTISIDENIAAWKNEKSTNTNIVSWIAEKNHPFLDRFAIDGIPRFILIGPDGKPINSKMPAPSDKNFETLLKQYVSL